MINILVTINIDDIFDKCNIVELSNSKPKGRLGFKFCKSNRHY